MLAAIDSTLVVVRAMDFYFQLIRDVIENPRLKQHPYVLFMSITFPT